MSEIIYVPDIECDSCVKLITKKFDAHGISDYHIKQDHISLNNPTTSSSRVIDIIKELGFRASTTPFDRKTLKERLRDVKDNTKKYALEVRGLKYTLGVFATLVFLMTTSYYGFLNTIPNFLGMYGWWVLYLIISITVICGGLWHFFAYQTKFTCMMGMMIGMTFGMQTGMMIGAVVGATNGFFMGSMVGMILGVAVGIWTGKCCGSMGVMEGMMAGLMGGTMGPMITVMMFSDHVLWFMPLYMIINIAIIAGLSYMLFEEVVENNKTIEKSPADFTTIAALSVITTFIIMVIVLYGPKSALLSF
jgi:hypothetical protein